MKRFIFCLVILLLSLNQINTLPTTFDLRVQPDYFKFAEYSLQYQGTCIAHAWGLQLAQIVSNAISLQSKTKITLSSQHLIECISSINDICHHAQLSNIDNALHFIQTKGLVTTMCIKNRLFQTPKSICPIYCDNGQRYINTLKAKATLHNTFQTMLQQLTSNTNTAAFVVMKVYDSYNYYSSQKPVLTDSTDAPFEYRVAQVVGWRKKGSQIIVRLGNGAGWGFNGFANIDINEHSKLIQRIYTINALMDSKEQNKNAAVRINIQKQKQRDEEIKKSHQQ